ncbi:UDP-2,3-diacylglucosamine diphosphatase [Alteromonas sp. 5E99-2]|uniref:UDP-2,3-diacylglucosamine diphosphatase n=1 Tax=Alteromonas sp. 5E99-2 TaxID=2817683 RepID=UPI001A99F256|nr:UDP-2,3-diacylglucosamine diphosphatase [Alteromonas sp. 5E99-2]MBO1256314.1 UDP-2,3-diacylglucosamine diphosphatase [Alteromonas sp. 5E99-2]
MAFTYFISDIHLSESRQDITDCLLDFLANEADKADALYVLGDLFEYWIGDDNVTPLSESVASAFHALSKKIPLYFIHGNRDFGIRQGWAKSAGMTLLPEQYVIDLYGTKTLISHGDELCTLDVDYQKFRKKARSWWWPRMMLALPLSLRKRIAENGRKKSQSKQKNLAADILDVTPEEVVKAMEHHKVTQFIHGHTHRPNIHCVKLSQGKGTRIVLGDWYSQGSIGKFSQDSVTLENRSL